MSAMGTSMHAAGPDMLQQTSSAVSALITTWYLTAISVLATFLCIRARSNLGLRHWPLFKILVCSILLTALAFVYATGILVLGIDLSTSLTACTVAGWFCILAYMLFKLNTYLFLMERVHLVYSVKEGFRTPRFKAPWYRICSIVVIGWSIVAATMIVGRFARLRASDGACEIGLANFSTIPLIILDGVVYFTLTLAFALPVWRSRFGKAQRLAACSCVASIFGVATSSVNIAWLTGAHGHELSWACLAACSVDIFVNASIIFAITNCSTQEEAYAESLARQGAGGTDDDSYHTAQKSDRERDFFDKRPVVPLTGLVISSQTAWAVEEHKEDKGDEAKEAEDAPRPLIDILLEQKQKRSIRQLPSQHSCDVPFSTNTIKLQPVLSGNHNYNSSTRRPQTAPEAVITVPPPCL